MKIKVNPNRMELLRLRRRLVLAKRGHKLLKDKQEELMRRFMDLIKQTDVLRKEIEPLYKKSCNYFALASAYSDPYAIFEDTNLTTNQIDIEVSLKPVLNLRVPFFKIKDAQNAFSVASAKSSGNLDESLRILNKILPQIMRLAEMEKTVYLLASELETTRRRVNALEHILIPNLQETIRFISDKLSENERSTLTRLLKVKDIVRSH